MESRNNYPFKAIVKKLDPRAVIPTRGQSKSAGYDVYALLDCGKIEIPPQSSVLIHTGLQIRPPYNHFVALFARQGLACKQNLRPSNCVGVLDEDYTGEYLISLYNDQTEIRVINDMERIAQLVFIPYADIEFSEILEDEKLPKTERGDGGFGSTGKK